MKKELFDKLISVPNENSVYLATVADTCIEHLKWVQSQSELSIDDEGLATVERAFLYCYGLCLKHNLFGEKN